jgi:hypothetical protein
MKTPIQFIAGLMLAVFSTLGGEPSETSQMIFRDYAALKWDKILPELGDDSPQICILRVDPKTKATQLLIRTPTAIHVRRHWHSANETHTTVLGA